MKVVFLVHSLRKGGAEKLVLELAACQKELEAEISIISWLDTMEWDKDQYKDIEIKSIIQEKDYKWLFSLLSSSKRLRKILSEISPDSIFLFSHSVLWLSLVSRYKTSYTNVIQGFNQISKFRKLKRLFYRPIDIFSSRMLNFLVITPTKALAEETSKYLFIEFNKIKIIPNGIELNRQYTDLKDTSYPSICMLGTLGRQKGQHLALEGMFKLIKRFPDVHLNIVGDGELKDYLSDEIINLQLENNVHLLGRVEDPFQVLKKADIFWHLSITEGMPLSIIEAMAIGLPVVGFNVEGVRDVVSDSKNGYLLEYGDIDGLIEKTALLLESHEKRRNMSVISSELYNSKYTKNKMLNGYKLYLRDLYLSHSS